MAKEKKPAARPLELNEVTMATINEMPIDRVAEGGLESLKNCERKIAALNGALFGDTTIMETEIISYSRRTVRSTVYDLAGRAQRIDEAIEKLAQRLATRR